METTQLNLTLKFIKNR